MSILTEKVLEQIARAGKAVIPFSVGKHPEDDKFESNSPAIDIHIVTQHHIADEATRGDLSEGPISCNDIQTFWKLLVTSENRRDDNEWLTLIEGLVSENRYFYGTISPRSDREDRIVYAQVISAKLHLKKFTRPRPFERSQAILACVIAYPSGSWINAYEPTTHAAALRCGEVTPQIICLRPRKKAG